MTNKLEIIDKEREETRTNLQQQVDNSSSDDLRNFDTLRFLFVLYDLDKKMLLNDGKHSMRVQFGGKVGKEFNKYVYIAMKTGKYI
jgi:hypothetical protein